MLLAQRVIEKLLILRDMKIEDYSQVRQLWEAEPGIKVSEVDDRIGFEQLLSRFPEISTVVELDGKIIGCVLGTEDSRRGYVHHLVVSPPYRNSGLGRKLMEAMEGNFRAKNIPKIHVFIMEENETVQNFYSKIGWHQRSDIRLMSKQLR